MKKQYFSFLLAAGMLFSTWNANASTDWHLISNQQIPSALVKNIHALDFQSFSLDINKIKGQLATAGNSFETGIDMIIPVGNEWQHLRVWRDDVLSPELQAKFPEIMAFTGVDPKNHAITAKLDLNVYGFDAMIIDPSRGTYFIDPYSLHSTEYYAGYWKKDMDPSFYQKGVCGTKGLNTNTVELSNNTYQMPNLNPLQDEAIGLSKPNGSVKRIYKCAVSCTGEWANMITGGAPSMPAVMSAIASVINRANGVFQRELSVKMELIPNNNEVVYIDPDSDPYTCPGETHECLIDQVQSNLDAVYPSPTTYDIGHIFCTTGGGLAQLQAVCQSGGKGSGVSGVFSTSDIGTLIHEMGHQMGTHHTFSANTGGCEGNGNESTAYEPGSGTSIMSYNGSCAPNNVAGPAFEYYHVASLKMIYEYIVTGPGASCGSTLSGITPVTVMNLGQNYKIPKNTPFELIADNPTYSEPAPPEVTFNWEQWDLGKFGETEADAASWDEGPTFESRAPIFQNSRQFPDNSLVAAGTYTAVGQRLSTVERELNFKLTNRTFFEGWGTFNYSDKEVKIDVVDCDEFRVTKPNATALYEVGAPLTVAWDTTQTRQAPISCGFVNIYLSVNGGLTFPILVVANAPNTGSYTMSAPNVYSDDIRFKVKGSGNIFYDISKTSVKIHGEHLGMDGENLEVVNNIKVYPNPTDNMLYLQYDNILYRPILVQMYSITGQLVFQKEMTQKLDINVSGMAKGTYLLQMIDQNTGKGRSEKVVVK